jgi:phospholipid/cholesterol/gamma-HCH transport system permease protein
MISEKLVFDYLNPGKLFVKLRGDWRIATGILSINTVTSCLASHPDIVQINLTAAQDLKWDSGLVSFLHQLIRKCESMNIPVDRSGLPETAQRLLALASKAHKGGIAPAKNHETFLERVGVGLLQEYESVRNGFEFLGDVVVSFGRLVIGKLYFRRDDFIFLVRRCGIDTFLLVSLIGFLVGMILAFVASIQLRMFGAQIYISDIVGIAMVRVLSAVMTGIIVSGRIGASFAAELGMMQTNEEIDALRTLGVSPVEFLVIPRVLALFLMMPILTIYADISGVLGGLVISIGMLHLNFAEYLNHTQQAVKVSYIWIGLVHSLAFAVIIAVSGCWHGMKCERSSVGVASATMSAVVTGITGIVIATAVITFICQTLGI